MNDENGRDLLIELAAEFELVLQEGPEEQIHAFIKQHLGSFSFLYRTGCMSSKFQLSNEYVTDFLAMDVDYLNDPRPTVRFIEIERADKPLFTRSGDPTAFLTHALRQVQDWKRWVSENRRYLQSVLSRLLSDHSSQDKGQSLCWDPSYVHNSPSLANVAQLRGQLKEALTQGLRDFYLVIAGRRNAMRVDDRLRLGQINQEFKNIQIITYDVIIDAWLNKALQEYHFSGWNFPL